VEAFSARFRSISSAAARWSALLTIAYLRNIEAVFHPPITITMLSGTPARRAALAAERRRSWGMRPRYSRLRLPQSHFFAVTARLQLRQTRNLDLP
jgi:hypothetical protein